MRRRDFITFLGIAAAAWPLAARAQQPGGTRRIGVLTDLAENDAEAQSRLAAFRQGLQQLGWTDGRNVRFDTRWGAGDADRLRRYAAELVALVPEVILGVGGPAVGPLLQASRTTPIVFVQVTDPVAAGYVASLARPGGNATGFAMFDFGISVKWLEVLKEISPMVTRVVILRDPTIAAGIGLLGAMQAAAPALRMELSPVGVAEVAEIERAITAFGRESNGGLVVLPGAFTALRRDLIIALAAQQRLPAVYPYRYYVAADGLISYGPNTIEPYRRAASYIDRILKGEKPADLPVQNPTKYELVINLKTAKALGLTVPPTLLARADEVIE